MSTELQSLGKYALQERLGTGGVTEVWKAFDPELQRSVALKIFHADLQNDPDFITRFWSLPLIAEAQLIVSLRHPSIVHIHGFQIFHPPKSERSLAYMATDYLEGLTLADYIRNTSYGGKFPSPADLVHLFASLAAGIDYAHQQGIIHGYITPGAILLDKHNTSSNAMGEPTFTDFGIAELLGIPADALSRLEPDTPSYISPEQVEGYPATERSDMYALGVILYEMCTGEQPFRGENAQHVIMQHINTLPPPPAQVNPTISPALSAVILRCLAKDPEERFPSAASMVTVLAEALGMPVPQTLNQSNYLTNTMNGQTNSGVLRDTLVLDPSSEASLPTFIGQSLSETSPSASTGQDAPLTAPGTPGEEERASESQAVSAASENNSPSPAASRQLPSDTVLPLFSPPPRLRSLSPPVPTSGAWPRKSANPAGPVMRKRSFMFVVLLITLLVATTLGTLGVLALHKNTDTVGATPPVVGQVYFLSSGHLYVNNNQGINDEVLIDLHNLAAPAAGKSYYAWLLGDMNQSEVPWVALGKVGFSGGHVHFLYPGDQAHTNLLDDMSRFLLTEGDTNTAPVTPLIDQSSWRYYSMIDQTPSVKDPNHFSLLDHLRHLLVQAPELKVLGLPGGLSIWMMRNVEEIAKWALIAKESWEIKDTAVIRQYLVNILYYLDGECTQQADLQGLPPVTPTTPENQTIAHIAHFALLNPCIQEEQEQANVLKQVFHHVPHNYVDHLLFHIAGVIQSPGVSHGTQALAVQINSAINAVKTRLLQMRQDAEQVLHMTDDQLGQLSALNLLSDLQIRARYAYTGQTDPTTGNVQEGVAWIYDNVERLAMFNVTTFASSSTT
jgi:eukaryotic-like serine/threonine-protein kinase